MGARWNAGVAAVGRVCCVGLGLGLFSNMGWAAGVVISGDITPAFGLGDAGNKRFFLNVLTVLGSGRNVAILESEFNPYVAPMLNDFYNAQPSVSSIILSGEVTPAALAGVQLLHVPAPHAAFSPAAVSAIGAFVANGGTLYVAGEATQIPFGAATNKILNDLLAGIGLNARLDNTSFDLGENFIDGAGIRPHKLTAGVDLFWYGATTTVTGGEPLFARQTGTGGTFITFVPEPGGAAASGAVGLAILARRTRRPTSA
jgi:hypothetical protein